MVIDSVFDVCGALLDLFLLFFFWIRTVCTLGSSHF
jgi:hypothetical protein